MVAARRSNRTARFMPEAKPAARACHAAARAEVSPIPADDSAEYRSSAHRAACQRRSSSGATSSASRNCALPARRRGDATMLRRRDAARPSASPTCSAGTTRSSATSGCTAPSASGPCPMCTSFLGAIDTPGGRPDAAGRASPRSAARRSSASSRSRASAAGATSSSTPPSATSSFAITAASGATAAKWPAVRRAGSRTARARCCHFWGSELGATAD